MSVEAGECCVTMSGEFGYSDSQNVRKMIEELKQVASVSWALVLSDVSKIDSAGLGMILLLNDAAVEAGKSLTVRGAKGQVEKMLDVTNFSELVTVE